jgi:hypothetical protein
MLLFRELDLPGGLKFGPQLTCGNLPVCKQFVVLLALCLAFALVAYGYVEHRKVYWIKQGAEQAQSRNESVGRIAYGTRAGLPAVEQCKIPVKICPALAAPKPSAVQTESLLGQDFSDSWNYITHEFAP